MSAWAQRRFWSEATVAEVENGFAVLLDGRRVRTPAKSGLTLPTRALAEAVAAEWAAQEGAVDPRAMPATRSANAAIDKVAPQHEEVAALLTDYGGSDLLCYCAEAPEELARRQAEAWDPLLDWAAERLGARLRTVTGVMHVPQDPEALLRLRGQVAAQDEFALAAFHDLVSLSGSLILAFSVTEGLRRPEDAWRLSRIDEDWQIEQWGEDEEAAQTAARKREDFLHAAWFHALARERV